MQLGSAECGDSESRGPITGFVLNMAAFPRVREREACDFESLGLIEGSVTEQERGRQRQRSQVDILSADTTC